MVVVISRVYEQEAETSCVPTLLISRFLLISNNLHNRQTRSDRRTIFRTYRFPSRAGSQFALRGLSCSGSGSSSCSNLVLGSRLTRSDIAPIQKASWARKTFEYGTWGGEFRSEFQPEPGEIVAAEHWCSSGFANTDLDLQLKRHGIHQLIVIGLIAHTCIEATVRFAAELGYEVTVVRDATADYSDEMMHAALDINLPNYANAIVTTTEIVDAISQL